MVRVNIILFAKLKGKLTAAEIEKIKKKMDVLLHVLLQYHVT
jgi:hypothetical protein